MREDFNKEKEKKYSKKWRILTWFSILFQPISAIIVILFVFWQIASSFGFPSVKELLHYLTHAHFEELIEQKIKNNYDLQRVQIKGYVKSLKKNLIGEYADYFDIDNYCFTTYSDEEEDRFIYYIYYDLFSSKKDKNQNNKKDCIDHIEGFDFERDEVISKKRDVEKLNDEIMRAEYKVESLSKELNKLQDIYKRNQQSFEEGCTNESN